MTILTNIPKNFTNITNTVKNTAGVVNKSKSFVTLSNIVKNTSNVSNTNNVSLLAYLLTPNLNKILVGSTETDTLILWDGLSITNLIKH